MPSSRSATGFLLVFLLLVTVSPVRAQSDWPVPYQPEEIYKKMESSSFYMQMRDGVELACDLFLPAGLPQGTRIPTVIHITRYWRAFDVKWPFRGMLDPGPPSMNILLPTETLVKAGYAVLSVDARGSGASFGSEIIPMGPDEVEDGRNILDWVVAQPWSDGQAAATGISYNGWAAQMLVSTGHPALKAVVPIHAPFDGFDDLAMPGGLFNRTLINRWAGILRHMDQGDVHSSRKAVNRLVRGPSPIDGRENALDSAYLQHRNNGYADIVMPTLQDRDDRSPLVGDHTLDDFFPSGHMNEVRAFQGPVYAITGWYDMAGPHASVRIYKNYGGSNKILIGPWNHFAERNISPYNPGKATFDRAGEIIRFLDACLKGRPEVLENEQPVHYFTIGAERWNSAESWPPPQAQAQGWFLSGDQQLIPDQATAGGRDLLQVDTSIGTGKQTRWDLSSQNHSTYEGLDSLQKRWMCYTSAPLERPLEITGHPSVQLYIRSPQEDESIFVYLEEVTATGKVLLITDGQLRARHRQLAERSLYTDVVPLPTMLAADALPLVPGEPAMIEIDLIPCSWELQPGSRIRLALSGADRDHFRPVGPNHELEVLRGGKYPSVVVLPVMRPGHTAEH